MKQRHDKEPVLSRGAPLGQGPGVMIMIHGRNAGPGNILELVPAFDQPEFTYLAPAAANGTWYPLSFLSEIQKNEPGISSGIKVIHGLIEKAIAAGVPSSKIVVLGFSQGACLGATAVLRRPGRYGGVIVYSGGLIGPSGTAWEAEGTFDGTPVFLGCSDVDAHIPKRRVDETAAVFTRYGADVTERIYPGMGHTINDEEIAFARDLVARIAAS